MRKLVLFGDSLIKNLNKEMCDEIGEKADVDVYNCAVGGWNSYDGVEKAPFIAGLKPELVVLSFGTNDSAPWKKVELEKFKANLEQIFQSFSDAEKIFFLPPPVNEKLQTGGQRRLNSLVEEYYTVAKELCLSNKVKIMDSWQVFKPMLDSGQNYHDDDGVHFNDLGYKTLIDEIVKLARS